MSAEHLRVMREGNCVQEMAWTVLYHHSANVRDKFKIHIVTGLSILLQGQYDQSSADRQVSR